MSDTELPVLALDVDGVLLDYVEGLGRFVESRGHALGCHHTEIADWNMSNYLPSMTLDERIATYAAFSETEGFGNLVAYEGAVEAIAEIRETFPGLRILAITSAGTSAETERLRRLNLEPFGIDDLTVLPLGASKEEHFARLPKGSVVVDDLLKHVKAADDTGNLGVFFRRSYNLADAHPRSVRDWPEAVATICSILEETHSSAPRMVA
jgi:hypothetical protein